jgi:hypothetical protein
MTDADCEGSALCRDDRRCKAVALAPPFGRFDFGNCVAREKR